MCSLVCGSVLGSTVSSLKFVFALHFYYFVKFVMIAFYDVNDHFKRFRIKKTQENSDCNLMNVFLIREAGAMAGWSKFS